MHYKKGIVSGLRSMPHTLHTDWTVPMTRDKYRDENFSESLVILGGNAVKNL
jgi:hypothetical protein